MKRLDPRDRLVIALPRQIRPHRLFRKGAAFLPHPPQTPIDKMSKDAFLTLDQLKVAVEKDEIDTVLVSAVST